MHTATMMVALNIGGCSSGLMELWRDPTSRNILYVTLIIIAIVALNGIKDVIVRLMDK